MPDRRRLRPNWTASVCISYADCSWVHWDIRRVCDFVALSPFQSKFRHECQNADRSAVIFGLSLIQQWRNGGMFLRRRRLSLSDHVWKRKLASSSCKSVGSGSRAHVLFGAKLRSSSVRGVGIDRAIVAVGSRTADDQVRCCRDFEVVCI